MHGMREVRRSVDTSKIYAAVLCTERDTPPWRAGRFNGMAANLNDVRTGEADRAKTPSANSVSTYRGATYAEITKQTAYSPALECSFLERFTAPAHRFVAGLLLS